MKIDIGFDKIDKIYHVADIHLRNIKRHREYRQVFKKFYEEVKKRGTDNSIIYLAGDLVHAKLEISPELVRELSYFFFECAEMCPTIVIAGNHDCNLNNSHRLDALSPIIDNLDHPNLHYLKDSGVYDIADCSFIVYGVFDTNQQENWPEVPDTDKKKIGLFHGPIHNSVTDVGYVISNRSVNRDTFKDCDIVLCGDIHKRQIVSTEPLIAYAGSLIQQSHGEALDGHGFIVWEFEDNKLTDGDFVDIENDWGYYTLDINDGKVPKVDDMPKFPRLRVRITNTPAAKVKRALTRVRKLYKISEFTVTRMDTLSKLKTGVAGNTLDIGDVTNVDFQNELIQDYLSRQYPIDEETLSDIEKINGDLNTRLPDEEITRNVNWKPVKFTFSNMFSYGENNEIRFDNMEGVYGLFAPNATGKSSLFDAISFCLFDKCSRAFKASHIMNNRKTRFKCKLELEIDNVTYFIERTATTVRKGKHVKVDVRFWKDVGGQQIELNGEHRRSTNDVIRQYIGTYDDFVLTALSLQNQNAIFIDKSQSERKDLLAQFMGINIFDKLYTLASEDILEVKTLLKKMKKEDYDVGLSDIELTITEKEAEYKQHTSDMNLISEHRKGLHQGKIERVKQLVPIDSKIVEIDTLTANLEKLIDDKEDIKLDKSNIRKDIADIKKDIVQTTNEIEKLEESKIEDKFKEYQKNKDKLAVIEPQIQSVTSEIENKTEHLSHYDDIEYDTDCDFCVKNAKTFENTAYELKESLDSLEKEASKLLMIANVLRDYVSLHRNVITTYKLYKMHQGNLQMAQFSLSGKETQLAKADSEMHKLNGYMRDIKGKIKRYHQSKDTIKRNAELQLEIDELDGLLNEHDQKIKKSNEIVLSLHGEISALESEKKWYNSQIDTLLELENKFKTYEYYLDAVKRDGVPYELIVKTLPVIEGEVNNILQQIVDFGMVLEIEGKNINGKLVYEDRQWPLEMCSGMERFISGLAIRAALINICNLPRPNFLVIDEGFGTLDHNNIAAMFMLFTYLKTQFDFIMIISHLDSMRDVVDSLIEIKKVDGYTYIQNQ